MASKSWAFRFGVMLWSMVLSFGASFGAAYFGSTATQFPLSLWFAGVSIVTFGVGAFCLIGLINLIIDDLH